MTRQILQWLIRLAPRSFRKRYQEEILAVHERRTGGARSVAGRLLFATREIWGLALTVARLRSGLLQPTGARPARQGARHPGRSVLADRRVRAALERAIRDLRYAVRVLRRSPGFSIAAIGVLALGIGAVTAIFSAANAFLFSPLPFGEPDRLVMLYETNPEFDWEQAQAAPANVLDWREGVPAFDDIAMYSEFLPQVPIVREGRPELLGVSQITGNFFSVLGVRPHLGRGFEWSETWQGNSDVVILSYSTWMTHFGGDADVIGRSFEFGATTARVIGVAPEGFGFPTARTQLWSPWGWDPASREQTFFRRAHWVRPVARLASGVSPERANAELQLVVDRLQTDFPETNRVMGAGFMPLRDFLVRDARGPLYLLLGAVALLLLLACVNVANLMLVHAGDRARDVALHFALGAGRARVARQLVSEGLVLALVGGAIGLGIGWVGVRALAARQTVGIGGATHLALDLRVVLFTVGIAVVSALVFTTVPALRMARGDVHATLKETGRGGSRGRSRMRTANALVAGQMALTLLLVVGAGLMVRTSLQLRDVDPGFRTESVLGVQFSIPSTRYADRDAVLAFQDEFERRLEARSGIERVGVVGQLPLAGQSWSSQFQAEGWSADRVGLDVLHRRADAGYFDALDIPLIRGRLFGDADSPDAPLVVVINETLARQYFPGEDPIGQRVTYDRTVTDQSIWYEIVGIVGDQQQISPGEPARAEVFENRRQDWGRQNWFVIRTAGDATHGTAAVNNVLAELDPLIPIAETRALREVWRSSMAREELLLGLLGAFALSALLLATVGVYGVTTQAARKRSREIGIRIALGAQARDVLRMVLGQGLAVVGIGLALGVGASLVVTRVMATFLFGVAPHDPLTIALVVGLLATVATAACFVPARRATTVDPASSLRAD